MVLFTVSTCNMLLIYSPDINTSFFFCLFSCYFAAVSSCITTYKKTPPPVPPRTTPSKPFISITAQSSTESAQDAYMDGGSSQRAGISSQQGLSNSTESIDSMKALTAAIEAANAQVHGPASQHVTNSTITITATATTSVSADSKAQREALRKCLSIGIQVWRKRNFQSRLKIKRGCRVDRFFPPLRWTRRKEGQQTSNRNSSR